MKQDEWGFVVCYQPPSTLLYHDVKLTRINRKHRQRSVSPTVWSLSCMVDTDNVLRSSQMKRHWSEAADVRYSTSYVASAGRLWNNKKPDSSLPCWI